MIRPKTEIKMKAVRRGGGVWAFYNTGTETIAVHPHRQTGGLPAANGVSHFRGGVFYLASTHRSPPPPPASDLTAAFVMGIW